MGARGRTGVVVGGVLLELREGKDQPFLTHRLRRKPNSPRLQATATSTNVVARRGSAGMDE
jgi:hypothetical protein